jgi:type II secretory pathway component PulK
MRRQQEGVALVLVLLVTAIIILLVMQLSLTASEQVRRAQALKDRSEASLYLHSREAALLYTLLTEPLVPSRETANPYAANWNFHGEPFEIDGLEVTLQDQSGLMRFPSRGVSDFRKLLAELGLGPARARGLAESLAQWIGDGTPGGSRSGGVMMRGGTGGPVQYFAELRALGGVDEKLYARLAELMTLYPTPGFNPLTAPATLLRLRMPEAALAAVLDARRSGALDQNRLWSIAGIAADETVVPSTGPGIGIRLRGEHLGVVLRRHVVARIDPYDEEPLSYWSRERFASGVPK